MLRNLRGLPFGVGGALFQLLRPAFRRRRAGFSLCGAPFRQRQTLFQALRRASMPPLPDAAALEAERKSPVVIAK